MRKELLLEVAYDKFAQKGYGATLSEIATGAGIKKQTIYNYFKDKDDLFYEMIKMELLNFFSTKTSEVKQLTEIEPDKALKKIFFSICNYYTDIKKLKFWRWMLLIESKDLFERCRDVIRENEREFYHRIKIEFIAKIQRFNENDEKSLIALQAFVVMIHGVMDGMLLYHDVFDPVILMENTWGFFWSE